MNSRTALGRIALGLLAAGFVSLAWILSSQAQVIDSDACQRQCDEAKTACIDRCGDEVDPVECEGTCEDQADDCIQRCGG